MVVRQLELLCYAVPSVIGADIAGVAASWLLADHGRQGIVLAARNRTGGRVWRDHSWSNAPLRNKFLVVSWLVSWLVG